MSDTQVIQEIDSIMKENKGKPEEMNLDGFHFSKFSKEITSRLEKCKGLSYLALNQCGIESLSNFPKLPELVRLELYENKFQPSEIAHIVEKIPKIQILLMGENTINNFEDINCLKNLKDLVHLDLTNTNLSKKSDYREKVLALLPKLQILDEHDRDGNAVELDEDGEEDLDEVRVDGSEEDFDDDDENFDDDDDDEEFEAKNTKSKKVKKN